MFGAVVQCWVPQGLVHAKSHFELQCGCAIVRFLGCFGALRLARVTLEFYEENRFF